MHRFLDRCLALITGIRRDERDALLSSHYLR